MAIKKLISSLFFINLLMLINEHEARNISKSPNIIMIIADDLGIGDIGCYGNNTIKTPNIDKLASEGVVLHHHLSVASLCSPSRAAILTARYPARFGFEQGQSGPPVPVHIASKVGLPKSENTIAEILSSSGYRTGIIGKWHLGSSCSWFGQNCSGPLSHGFDYFYGLPFSLTTFFSEEAPFWIFDLKDSFYQALLVTSLIIFLPFFGRKITYWSLMAFLGLLVLCIFIWFMYTHYRLHTEKWWQVSVWMSQAFDGIVMRNSEVIHKKIPFDSLFEELVNESVRFIHESAKQNQPFFLFHSFTHVHIPLFNTVKFRGQSAHGRYGDNVEEMDYGVGRIMKAIQETQIDEDTVVYFASDHGGCVEAVDPADGQMVGGYNKKFKGGKGMGAAEGGIRIPGVFRWKGTLPSKVSLNLPNSQLDLLPTFLELADIQMKETDIVTKKIDGISIAPFLREPKKRLGEERVLLHHCGREIHALRHITDTKVYKMYLFRYRWEGNNYHCGWGLETHCGCFGHYVVNITDSPVLFELLNDPYEDYPIYKDSQEYRTIVPKLQSYLKNYKENNPYPPSQFESKLDVILSPWLQPF